MRSRLITLSLAESLKFSKCLRVGFDFDDQIFLIVLGTFFLKVLLEYL